MNQDALKLKVGEAAVQYIDPHLRSDSIVGVGTGSTANYFIDALATIKHKFEGTVASSIISEERLKSHGIHVYELNSVKNLRFYVDGADEANDKFELIKGGGGALTREKIVASVAEEFVCIVDESKLVTRLGNFPLPVEVIPMARSSVARQLVAIGGRPVYKNGFTTDNRNLILDVFDLSITDAPAMEMAINNMTGVVTNGLFARKPADILLVGTDSGVETRRLARKSGQ